MPAAILYKMRQKSQSLTIHGKFFDKQHGTAPQEATLEYQYINKKSVCLFSFYCWINQYIYYFLSFIYHFNKHYGGNYDAWWQMTLKFSLFFLWTLPFYDINNVYSVQRKLFFDKQHCRGTQLRRSVGSINIYILIYQVST